MNLRQSLFWDTNIENIDLKKNAQYIIERVLDLGHDDEVRWIWQTYSKELLKKVVDGSRSLRPETKNLWMNLLAIK